MDFYFGTLVEWVNDMKSLKCNNYCFQLNIIFNRIYVIKENYWLKMMEVENRIETFGGQVDELPDELKDRRQSGGSGGHAVILEESEEDSRDGLDAVGDKSLSENCPPVNGRVIKKVKQISIK